MHIYVPCHIPTEIIYYDKKILPDMKKTILTLILAGLACMVASAQVTIDITSEYNIPGGKVKYDSLPTYYAEDGVMKFTFSGTDSWGHPDSLAIDLKGTTVKDSTQISRAKRAAERCEFERYIIGSAKPLSGTIKYIYHKLNTEERDSLRTEAAAVIAQNSEALLRASVKPYYTLYQTDNMWNLIELDTVTGALWQVQFSIDSGELYRFKTILDLADRRKGSYYPDTEEPGRFELFKTQNMYNFILLDTLDGRVWQVQWSTDKDKRGVIPIL